MNLRTIGATCIAGAIGLFSGASMAADYTENPFTLVYDGAITGNVAGAVKWPYSNPQTQEFFK